MPLAVPLLQHLRLPRQFFSLYQQPSSVLADIIWALARMRGVLQYVEPRLYR